MNRNLSLMLFVAAAVAFASPPANSEEKMAWGLLTGQLDISPAEPHCGIVRYNIEKPEDFTIEYEIESGRSISGGLYVDNKFYWYEWTAQPYGYDAEGIYCYDIESGSVREVINFHAEREGQAYCSPTYDYSTGKVYALNWLQNGSGLVNIDLETGVISKCCTFKGLVTPAGKTMNETIKAVTCTYDGLMYGVSYWGALYSINKDTGECSKIADLDYNPEEALMYTQSLAYDNNNDQLYWLTYQWVNLYEQIRRLDVKTGKSEQVSIMPDQRLFNDFHIDFTAAPPSAPAKVSDLSVAAGERGELLSTVSWTNPTKTFGRGGTLESLTKVDIYRNDELVGTIDAPEIGGSEKWTDTSIEKSGYYTYRIVPVNENGNGDRASVSTFIGHDIPKPVTDITLTAKNHGGHLEWGASPGGTLGGYVDPSALVYKIVRLPDDKTVAEACAETTFDDTSIDTLGRYSYTITPVSTGGEGESMLSNDCVLGPVCEIPHTFSFTKNEDLDTWTIIDGDGQLGNTWKMFFGYGDNITGVKNTWAYISGGIEDYLVSPRVLFKAGINYKLTFDCQTANKNVEEILEIAIGHEEKPEAFNAIGEFRLKQDGYSRLRMNLPVQSEDTEYNLAFVHKTVEDYFGITLNNISIEEDHEGYIQGTVTDSDRKPVDGVRLLVNGGEFTALTDANGSYTLKYLPSGNYDVTVSAHHYAEKTVNVSVEELKYTLMDITLDKLPVYTVSGKVIDIVGDPVPDAEILISGYDELQGSTDAAGNFKIENVYENEYYTVNVARNKLVTYTAAMPVKEDVDLGIITLDDNLKAPRAISAVETADGMEITWEMPSNDAKEYRFDDGKINRGLGTNNGNNNTVFGHVNRTPSMLESIKFYVASNAQVLKHYSVQVFVFDLDDKGNPTSDLLYNNTYVQVTDDAWNTFTFPAPIDAPNGYMVGISHYTWCGIGLDSGGDSVYPFVEDTNVYTDDYTTGNFHYIEDVTSEFRNNFAMRSYAAPYDMQKSTNDRNFGPRRDAASHNAGNLIVSDTEEHTGGETGASTSPAKMVEDRVRYDLYRYRTADENDQSLWTRLASAVSDRSYKDSEWNDLSQGVYKYGVKAVYTGNLESPLTATDSIGNKMLTNVRVKVFTNTKEQESEGAIVRFVRSDQKGAYESIADTDGEAVIKNVWKTDYIVTVEQQGFKTFTAQESLSDKDEYSFVYNLTENIEAPVDLTVWAEGRNDERTLVWNFPEVISDSFEEHDDFAINSPGKIGWQYIDADGAYTNSFSNYTYPNQFCPMAFQVFNYSTTEPAYADYNMSAQDGQKMLVSFAADGTASDDWLISPRLYFTRPFQLKFFSKSYSYYLYKEKFQIGYSENGTDTDNFIWVEENHEAPSYWQESTYEIPATAKYVAIRCVSNQGYVAMLDNIRIGYLDAPQTAPRKTSAKASCAEGLYEIWLNGERIANTDQTSYALAELPDGHYKAGVRSHYTSGYSSMAYVEFDIKDSEFGGVSDITDDSLSMEVANDVLKVTGVARTLSIVSADGLVTMIECNFTGEYNLANFPSGVYMAKGVSPDGETVVVKFARN